jgi:hypothetical protein
MVDVCPKFLDASVDYLGPSNNARVGEKFVAGKMV